MYTYYAIEKEFGGVFKKQHKRNFSYIVTTDEKTFDGMILAYDGPLKVNDKLFSLFMTLGWYRQSAEELLYTLKNFIVLEKIKSKTTEIINRQIDYASPAKMESPAKINIKLSHPGKYIQSVNNDFILYNNFKVNDLTWFVFLSNNIELAEEKTNIDPSTIKSIVYKQDAMFRSLINNSDHDENKMLLKAKGFKVKV